MTYLSFDEKNGKLKALQVLPTLPDTYTGEGQASASLLSKNGEILIGSNRIHESIVLYRIDQKWIYEGVGYCPTLGLTHILSPSTTITACFMANGDSDTIVEMRLCEETGRMEYTGRIIHTESPVCITFR